MTVLYADYIPVGLRYGCTDWWLWPRNHAGARPGRASVDFDSAVAQYNEAPGRYAGIGVTLSRADAYITGELRGCRDADTGQLSAPAQLLVQKIPTYWEITPNGTGIRFIARSRPLGGLSGNGLEVFSDVPFIVTGWRLTECAEPIELNHLQVRRLREYAHGSRVSLDDRALSFQDQQGILTALQDKGLYQRPIGDGQQSRHVITCPWWTDHPEMSRHGTIYTEHAGGAVFECQHCREKTIDHLKAWLSISQDRNLPFVFPADFTIEKTSFVIEGWLPQGEISLLYAQKDMLKSFVAVDMFLSVASGRAWQGNSTIPGLAIYIAGEGNKGLQKRMFAWAEYHHEDLRKLPIALSTRPMRVLDQDLSDWRTHIEAIESHFNMETMLIVVDTLSSNFGRGDENATSDVAEFIARLSQTISPHSHTAILVVHHTGKDATRGPRGSYALAANTNSIFTITAQESGETRRVDVTPERMKDSVLPPPVSVETKVVTLPNHPDVESLVLVPRLSAQEPRVLKLLREGTSQRDIATKLRMSQSSVSRVRDKLDRLGLLG